jgi:hypothetical protein
MTKPKRYEILRQVTNDSRIGVPLAEKPKQVWTLLNESGFLENGLQHNVNGFIEDSMHDWTWQDGTFRFYGHSGRRGEKHDLVIIYEIR